MEQELEKQHTNSSDSDHSTCSIPLKIFSANRRVRKLIGVSSYADLERKCKEKFGVADATPVSFVLDEDGVQVDIDGFRYIQPNSIIMILIDEEEWHPKGSSDQRLHEHSGTSTQSHTNSELIGYIETLKEKCSKKRKASTSLGQPPAPKQPPETLRISPGWRHYSYSKNQYTQVRSRRGMVLPSGDLLLKSNCDYNTCLRSLENLYFPNGRGIKGRLASMETKLGNFNGEVPIENFKLSEAAAANRGNKSKIYLLSRKNIPQLLIETDSESDEDEALPKPLFVHKKPSPQPGLYQDHIMSPAVLSPSASAYAGSGGGSVAAASENSLTTNSGGSVFVTPQSSNTGSFMVHADTPTVQMQLPAAMKKCIVCADREVDTIITPCIHTLCFVCAQHLYVNNERCPMCRGHIEEVKSILYG